MANVDPYIAPIPQKWLEDQSTREWAVYLNRFLHDLWVRTGGGSDLIASTELDANTFQIPVLYSRTESLQEEVSELKSDFELYSRVESLQEEVSELKAELDIAISQKIDFRSVTTSSNYTAVDHDFINATSRVTITMPAYPSENDVIIVRNGDGTRITLLGNGRNINGESIGYIRKKGTSLYLQYFIDTNEWLVR